MKPYSPALQAPLPIKDGVGPSYLWLPEGQWPDMLSFLCAQFPHIDRSTWLMRMASSEVVFGNGAVVAADSPFQRGQQVFYYREIEAEAPIPFAEHILFQDQHLLVADKPHFLPVIPSGRFLQETLLVRLKRSTGLAHLTPIHRLDRETAGVIIFSHNPATRGVYQSLFQQRAMHKVYHAIAPHSDTLAWPHTRRSCIARGEPFFRMQEIEAPANSETSIDVLERRDALSMYELRPLTGRQHQLRVHMSALGIPILNDSFYPRVLQSEHDDWSRPLQLLAREISFDDPISGLLRTFFSTRNLNFPPE